MISLDNGPKEEEEEGEEFFEVEDKYLCIRNAWRIN